MFLEYAFSLILHICLLVLPKHPLDQCSISFEYMLVLSASFYHLFKLNINQPVPAILCTFNWQSEMKIVLMYA
jgi:hypothetical protein